MVTIFQESTSQEGLFFCLRPNNHHIPALTSPVLLQGMFSRKKPMLEALLDSGSRRGVHFAGENAFFR
jgi:hypothetical protein